MLDVGCGTGQLGAAIASEGYDVFGVDLAASMLGKARQRGLVGTYAAVTTALPFADDTFDLALTVATLHHLETPERVAATVSEMGRIVKRGGFVVLWDHNPANPYWPILMKRVPQDSGDERLVPQAELMQDVQAAKLSLHRVFRSGFTPDFLPRALSGVWGAGRTRRRDHARLERAGGAQRGHRPQTVSPRDRASFLAAIVLALVVGHLLRDTPGYVVVRPTAATRATSTTTCTGRGW